MTVVLIDFLDNTYPLLVISMNCLPVCTYIQFPLFYIEGHQFSPISVGIFINLDILKTPIFPVESLILKAHSDWQSTEVFSYVIGEFNIMLKQTFTLSICC